MKAHLGGEPTNRKKHVDGIFVLFFFSLAGIALCKNHSSDLSDIRTWIFLVSALGLIMSGVLKARFDKKMGPFTVAFSDADSVAGQSPSAKVEEEPSAPQPHSC